MFIYDTTVPVEKNDKRKKGLVKSYHFSEFVEKFEEIQSLFGRQSVYTGTFDKAWAHIENKVEYTPIDKIFLQEINRWRLLLSRGHS